MSVTSLCPYSETDIQKGLCRRCGKALPKYKRKWCSEECALLYYRNHNWSVARRAALTRDGHQCVRLSCGSVLNLEVNHIIPRLGQGYLPGCHNHLDNLETLCHDCHLAVTARQRAERVGAKTDIVIKQTLFGPMVFPTVRGRVVAP